MIEANEVNSTFYALRMLSHGLDPSQIEVTEGEEYPASEFTRDEQTRGLEILREIVHSREVTSNEIHKKETKTALFSLADRVEQLTNRELAEAGYDLGAVEPSAVVRGDNAVFRHSARESDLRRAIENEEFQVYYQPRLALDSLSITGMEARVHWQHPQFGLLSPVEFMPLAENTVLIERIGEWVLRTACRQNKTWQEAGFSPIRIAVDISSRQFRQHDLVDLVAATLGEVGLAPEDLELAFAERSIMQNLESAPTVLNRLKAVGVKISIDKFGTGFLSLSYLKRLPLDALQIDSEFLSGVTTNQEDAAFVNAIVSFGHNLRLRVVAQGVKTEEQLRFLRLLRCDEAQGDLFSHPLSADESVEVFTNRAQLLPTRA